MNIPKIEQETIILYNEEEKEASIYTHDRYLKRRMVNYIARHPDLARISRTYSDGTVEYLMDKRYLRFRLLDSLSNDKTKG